MTSHRRLLAGFALLVLLLPILIAAVDPGRAATEARCAAPGEATREIFVVGHGWHVGIAAARGVLPGAHWPEQQDFPADVFLEIGWGDSAYYRAEDPGVAAALRAALRPSASVVHVAAFRRPPLEVFPEGDIVRLLISERGADSLAAFFHAAYAHDEAGAPVVLGPGLYGESRFYAGAARYHLFRNCNAWVAHALAAAGCRVRPGGVLTAGDVLRQLRRLATDS